MVTVRTIRKVQVSVVELLEHHAMRRNSPTSDCLVARCGGVLWAVVTFCAVSDGVSDSRQPQTTSPRQKQLFPSVSHALGYVMPRVVSPTIKNHAHTMLYSCHVRSTGPGGVR